MWTMSQQLLTKFYYEYKQGRNIFDNSIVIISCYDGFCR